MTRANKMKGAMDNMEAVAVIKANLNIGVMTYDQAKVALQPILDKMNIQGTAIAKKYGKKFKPFTATGLLR